ncbi:hypothetical protein FK531_02945 [Rhodococcus spelaei]|uniref:RNA polymerase sigma factor 70 region 4 type 2 domain-containing protein n=1 Tax=Rhodococcus spelaei TaxID=2546320 RepID=A0A541BRW7_9NOCA|nr:sigma factor-like helix-turn-helix DNA-binding protein [Rhodococcus spelaei]TQF75025.1 hypothetical protein FK531_02945 [Rhodococcus spelaei]
MWSRSGHLDRSRAGPPANPEEPASTLVGERDVARALVALPVEQRQPLVLAYYRGMSCDEVAQTLSLDVTVVIGRLHDGLTTMARTLHQAPTG